MSEYAADERALLQLLRGVCLLHLNSPLQAEEALLAVTRLQPQIRDDLHLVPFAWLELGLLALQAGRTDDAARILEHAKYGRGQGAGVVGGEILSYQGQGRGGGALSCPDCPRYWVECQSRPLRSQEWAEIRHTSSQLIDVSEIDWYICSVRLILYQSIFRFGDLQLLRCLANGDGTLLRYR